MNKEIEIEEIVLHSYYVLDGDTISTDLRGKRTSVRFRWVDCPETQKPNIPSTSENLNQWMWGDAAKRFLMSLLKDKRILVRLREEDMYGRLLGDIYLDSVALENNVQLMLVKAGFAADLLPIRKYDLSPSDSELFVAIVTEQNAAFHSKLGMWSDADFQIPFEWRKSLKTKAF
jgi:endonuclease YncB( thermonuclease family)